MDKCLGASKLFFSIEIGNVKKNVSMGLVYTSWIREEYCITVETKKRVIWLKRKIQLRRRRYIQARENRKRNGFIKVNIDTGQTQR